MSHGGGDAPLDIALDRDADVPLGVQLAWALRSRILGGALANGDRLPPLHRLGADVGVNANTVRAVYQRLEQEGLVTTRHGSGTFVTGADVGGGRRALPQLAAAAARAARDAGVDPREVAAALYVAAGSDDAGAAPPGDGAADRRRLRAQIAALEQALSHLTARQPSDAAPGERTPTPRPRLLTAAELAQQRDELLRRLTEAQAGAEVPDPPSVHPPPARRQAPSPAPALRASPRPT
jgi:GntR family transcriptional regulator